MLKAKEAKLDLVNVQLVTAKDSKCPVVVLLIYAQETYVLQSVELEFVMEVSKLFVFFSTGFREPRIYAAMHVFIGLL